jgi:hypothetical protein
MVHPDYRRKGIFTSDNNSVGGIEFIKNITDDFSHSEYDMNLDMNATQN